MISSFPIICGHDLDNQDRLLIDYWLSSFHRIQIHQTVPPPVKLSDEVHFIENVRLAELEQLLEWGYPLICVSRQNNTDSQGQNDFFTKAFDMGLSAIWELPAFGNPVILPFAHIPPRKGEIIVTTQNKSLKQHYRQILSFAGFDLRCDFSSADDIILALAQHMPLRSSEEPKNIPELIIIDLDSRQVDPLRLFTKLDQLCKKNMHLKRKLKILITKDFSIPGLDIRKIDQLLKPFARRIFHPLESLFALLESCHLNNNQKMPELVQSKDYIFRSLEEILYGKQTTMSLELPVFFPHFISGMESLRSIVAFQWLYRYIQKLNTRGLVLAPTVTDRS